MSLPVTPRSTPAAPPTDHDNGRPQCQAVTQDVPSTSTSTSAAPYAVFDRSSSHRPHPLQFQSTTIAPSPPFSNQNTLDDTHSLDVSSPGSDRSADSSSSSLRISTEISPHHFISLHRQGSLTSGSGNSSTRSIAIKKKSSFGNFQSISRTPSLKAAFSNSLGGPGSAASSLIPSPIISAMGDMSPLPSPLLPADSPGPWRRLLGAASPTPRSRLNSLGEGDIISSSPCEAEAMQSTPQADLLSPAGLPKPASLAPQEHKRQHTRNRSNSEYIPIPEGISFPKRLMSVSGPHGKLNTADAHEAHIRRELNYAEQRGLTPTVRQPPTPPPSESSKDSTELSRPKDLGELFEARGRHDKKRRRWRALRCLGQGTFSRVMLATSQIVPQDNESDSSNSESQPNRKTLVAVKVCEHGPRGGASEERVEMSLKRELEILQVIHHPSIVDLKAFSIEPTRAILVLCYSPGGDLFDVATAHRSVLSPALMRRIFAELVGALQYLHDMKIVHRDVKLENVLVNLSAHELGDKSIDWQTYPNSVITLTDLGLARRINDDEKLETRCGSDDYAAPEVIMGQPYDGRATDAWSLGVLLYALLESRLPFDPHPGMTDAHRMRSRTTHRIARVEWRWVEYGGDDTDNDGDEAKFEAKGLLGACEITEGLLKRARSRWSLEKVASKPWVKDAIRVEGGVKFWEEEEGEEIL
uniref:Protein kinase domain-containing protein n=1 Tax=Bionectria ochroleuca TaxID=29856 RepID=A0A8H7N5F9_BIOOC